MAIEFAGRFAVDHLGIDEDLFARLHTHFNDAEILDLCVCCARHLGFGRITQVLQLDQSCAWEPPTPP